MYSIKNNKDKIYNIILQSGVLPIEIINIIFKHIYDKGCII